MSVYFAKAGRYTKVGYSADPIGRMLSVTRTGKRPADLPYGADVDILGWIPGDEMREMAILVRFADQRVAGEWHVIDEAEVRDIIWADPRGIDVQRMSGMAVLASLRYPWATRDELAAQGFRIEAVTPAEGMASLSRRMRGAA